MKGIALKVTYNDGGAGGSLLGFQDVCSSQNMLVNVRERHMTNCSAEGNPCRRYVDDNFRGPRPTAAFCYERYLFANSPFEFGCGMYHHGTNKGEPIPVRKTSAGDIAFLTTVLPRRSSEERIVFGCFRIAREPYYRKDWGYMLESDGAMDIQLPDDVAMQMNFWRYFQNRNLSKKWGTGLFRYLTEKQTDHALGDLLCLLGDHAERDVLLGAIGSEVQPRPIRRVSIPGSKGIGGGGFAGGESDAHRKLKEHVAANPQSVGLPIGSKPDVEFPYQSGDQVDVKFDLPDGTFAVAEIETIDGWTGAHQCIKYRALLEAAQGLALGSGKVLAILVAHLFDSETLAFAAKYGIKTVQLKV